jgi:hypothetical protein
MISAADLRLQPTDIPGASTQACVELNLVYPADWLWAIIALDALAIAVFLALTIDVIEDSGRSPTSTFVFIFMARAFIVPVPASFVFMVRMPLLIDFASC